MTRSMFRYQVPIDGIPCKIPLTGDPVAFGALGHSAGIEFWAEHDDAAEPKIRTFTIAGTGHRIPPGAVYVGTAPRTRQGLVWHLYELTAQEFPAFGEPVMSTGQEAPMTAEAAEPRKCGAARNSGLTLRCAEPEGHDTGPGPTWHKSVYIRREEHDYDGAHHDVQHTETVTWEPVDHISEITRRLNAARKGDA